MPGEHIQLAGPHEQSPEEAEAEKALRRKIAELERKIKGEETQRMFPDMPGDLAALAFALIDAGLCFHTCPENCQGKCIEDAKEAVRNIDMLLA